MIGSIFLFEESRGGSGWLSFLLTSPFWLLFAVWPFIWLWLVTRRNDEWVEIDDDVISGENGETIARFVQKDGVRYVDIDAFADTFKCSRDVPTVTLPGGTERFARLDDVRHMEMCIRDSLTRHQLHPALYPIFRSLGPCQRHACSRLQREPSSERRNRRNPAYDAKLGASRL